MFRENGLGLNDMSVANFVDILQGSSLFLPIYMSFSRIFAILNSRGFQLFNRNVGQGTIELISLVSGIKHIRIW